MANETFKNVSNEATDAIDILTMLQGKIYEILTTGGEFGNPSEDNFFCWATPGIPVCKGDFDFVQEGLSGVVRAKVHTDSNESYGSTHEKKNTPAQQAIQKAVNQQLAYKFESQKKDLNEQEGADRLKEAENIQKDAKKEGSFTGFTATSNEQKEGEAAADAGTSTETKSENANAAAAQQTQSENEPQVDEKMTDADFAALRAERTTLLYVQAESLAHLVDFVPDVSGWKKEGGTGLAVLENEGPLSDIYQYTLRMSQVMAHELDEKTKQKLEKFRSLLVVEKEKTNIVTDEVETVIEESPMVKVYNEKMAAYVEALEEYNSYRIAALAGNDPVAVQRWALNAKNYYNKVKAARASWETAGYKNEYEQIQAFINQVMQRDMSMLKQEYKEVLERATLTGISSGSDFLYTTLSPMGFVNSKGWTQITFDKSDYSDHYRNLAKSNSSSIGITTRSIFHSHKSEHSWEEDQQDQSQYFNLSDMSISFEICQVNIVRPWFKTAFLTSKYWRFDPSATKGEYLSDGAERPSGKMPAYPTSIIFIRNLKIDFGTQSNFAKYKEKHNEASHKGSAGVNIGFFNIGGGASYAHRNEKTENTNEHSVHESDMSVTVPGMQIIGYRCHLLGKCPDPKPDIKEWI